MKIDKKKQVMIINKTNETRNMKPTRQERQNQHD